MLGLNLIVISDVKICHKGLVMINRKASLRLLNRYL